MADKIAGAVVLYHPTEKTLESIRSYIGSVKVLYAMDNSEKGDRDILSRIRKIKKVKYVSMKGNRGIAEALNRAAGMAVREHYDWLLTMDQDSLASPGIVAGMLKCNIKTEGAMTGILTAAHQVPGEKLPTAKTSCEKVLIAMTSGNLLNLSVYGKVGPFRNDFFIDSVDHEYCLRLNRNGYAVIRSNRSVLVHPVGNPERKKFFNRSPLVSNHNPLRRYYITRNRLVLSKMYKKDFPEFCRSEIRGNWKDLAKIVLFEKEKLRKIAMIVRACLDYLRGRMGKYGR